MAQGDALGFTGWLIANEIGAIFNLQPASGVEWCITHLSGSRTSSVWTEPYKGGAVNSNYPLMGDAITNASVNAFNGSLKYWSAWKTNFFLTNSSYLSTYSGGSGYRGIAYSGFVSKD